MNPAARFSAALLAALVLWWPSLAATMRGDMGLSQGALRYLAAFLFTRLAVEGLVLLFRHYAPAIEDDDLDLDDGMTSASAS